MAKPAVREANRVSFATSMPTITVRLDPPYDIVIEAGAVARLGEIARSILSADRAIVIADANIVDSHAKRAGEAIEAAGFAVTTVTIIADEAQKTLETVRSLYECMLSSRLDRGSPVIVIGGGIVGDVAGFAAATFMRGLPLMHVPTTLLAMVDAAIGGKTGVNLPLPAGGLGKNMIGAFHQPRAVIADPKTLRTLDLRELRCGLAECIKHGIIADPDLLAFLRDHLEAILSLDINSLTTLIERSARIKAAIVAEDERESGRRALLNLGHTFAHAIESFPELGLKHGEAVAIGLCAAARAAVLTERLSEADGGQIESLIEAAGLPRRLPIPIAVVDLMNRMGYDKKVAQGRLRLILPCGLGSAEVVCDVPTEIIERAWAHVEAS